MSEYTVSLTGHRPTALWGYDLNHPNYKKLQLVLESKIKTYLETYNTLICHCGFALGADTIWAKAIINMKQIYGGRVIFTADIPCRNQASQWPASSQRTWAALLSYADRVKYYADEYSPQCMLDRDDGMVDAADELIAIWNGQPYGGTAHTVKYAQKTNVPIHILNPETIMEQK